MASKCAKDVVQRQRDVRQAADCLTYKLYIIGTDGRDKILVRLGKNGKSNNNNGRQFLRVVTKFDIGNPNNPRTVVTNYDADAITTIVILTGDGDDSVKIHKNVTIDTYVDAGTGNNRVVGRNHGFFWDITSDENQAPEVTSFSNSSPELGGASAGEEVTVNGTFTDPGTLDTHTAIIDWGDGTTTTAVVIEANGAGLIAGNHTYANAGVFTITLTLTDDDSATAMATTSAVVSGVAVKDGVLYIVGTDGKDKVLVRLRNKDDGPVLRVVTKFDIGNPNAPKAVVTEFDANAITKIVILTGDGNDSVKIHKNVTIETYVDAGAGNNRVVARNRGYFVNMTSGDFFANADLQNLLLTL